MSPQILGATDKYTVAGSALGVRASRGSDPVKVQLLYFRGCPHVDEARKVLLAALRACALMEVAVEELDVEAATTPIELRQWGSPTILVNGADVAGEETPAGLSCRLYPGGEPPGVPPQRLIERSVRNALSTGSL